MEENSYGLYLQESVMQVIRFLKTPQLVLNMQQQQQGTEHLSDHWTSHTIQRELSCIQGILFRLLVSVMSKF